jgi:hypothetical protein
MQTDNKDSSNLEKSYYQLKLDTKTCDDFS